MSNEYFIEKMPNFTGQKIIVCRLCLQPKTEKCFYTHRKVCKRCYSDEQICKKIMKQGKSFQDYINDHNERIASIKKIWDLLNGPPLTSQPTSDNVSQIDVVAL